jgi:hypothetical protein
MPRLYRCPPELAGDIPAQYIAHPLPRWSRHRQLLAVMATLRLRDSKFERLREGFLNVGAWLAILGVAMLAAVSVAIRLPRGPKHPHSVLSFWGVEYVLLGLLVLGTLGLLIGLATLLAETAILFIPFGFARPFHSKKGGRLGGTHSAFPALKNPRVAQVLEDLSVAGLGFRGVAALAMSRSALISRDEWRRWRWEWPLFGALGLGILPSYSVTDATLGALAWFFIFRVVGPAMRLGFGDACSPQSILWALSPKSKREITPGLRRTLRRVLGLLGWMLAGALLCYGLLAWTPLSDWLGLPYPDGLPGACAIVWAIIVLTQRRRVEVLLMAGDPLLQREVMRRGEEAFRVWIQERAEASKDAV